MLETSCKLQSTNQKGVHFTHSTDLCIAFQIVSGAVYHPEPPLAHSLVLFPTISGDNLIPFLDAKKDSEAIHSIVYLSLISCRAICEWRDEEHDFFGNRKCETTANFRTTRMVTMILKSQNEERVFWKKSGYLDKESVNSSPTLPQSYGTKSVILDNEHEIRQRKCEIIAKLRNKSDVTSVFLSLSPLSLV